MSRIAVGGHSFGGCTAIKAAKDDPRISCGFSLDGWMFPLSKTDMTGTTNKSLLFVNSDLYLCCINKEFIFV